MWDNAKVTYRVFKLGRRSDPANKTHIGIPWNGALLGGLDCLASNITFYEDGKEGTEELQSPEGLIPKIGSCVSLQASKFNSGNCWLRTSRIEDFYIHEDYENSKDKIIMKSEDAILLDEVTFKQGDILLKTMNSYYLLKADVRETNND